MPSDGRIDQTFLFAKLTIGDGQICLLYSPILKLLGQFMVSLVIFGNDHDSRCILIQTVNDTRSDDTIDPSKILTIIEERIDQSA